MREKIVAGNWKMNLSISDAKSLWYELNSSEYENVTVLAFPPSLYLSEFAESQKSVRIGAQNIYSEENGAFTGEISAEMLSSCNIPYTLVGHSERRQLFDEKDELLKNKVDAALKADVKVIFCCGEPLEIRKRNTQTEYVLKQIENCLFHLSNEDLKNITIAYEPIWAIGTGETATPEQAQEMHAAIRGEMKDKFGNAGENVSILYGGSCKPSNAKQIFEKDDVDGGLIGGASLKYEDFVAIINAF